MNMEVAMFKTITGDVIDGRIGSVGRCLALHNHKIDEADNNQHAYRNEADRCDALPASGTLPFFFMPPLFLPASFLPRLLTSALLAHSFHFPFGYTFQACISIVQCVAGHISIRNFIDL